MNSTGRLSNKGSADAASYAQKRQMQMERARQLREERKNGVGSSSSSSVFKNVGHESLIRQGSTNSRSAQHTQMSVANAHDTTATSMMSSPGPRYDAMNNSGQQMPSQQQRQYSQMGYNNAGGFQQQNMGNDNFNTQMDAFSQPLHAGNVGNFAGGPSPQPQMNQNFGLPHPNNMHSDGFMRNSNNNFSGGMMHQREGMIINNGGQGPDGYQNQQNPQMHRNRSFNAYQPPPHQMLSPQSLDDRFQNLPPRHTNFSSGPPAHLNPSPGPGGMHTISHEAGYSGNNFRQQQNTMTGFSQQNLQTQQDFNAFRSAQSTQYPGHLTPNRQTHYSQRDVEEARGSLTLLKKRMSSSRDRQRKNSTIEYVSGQTTGNMSMQDQRSQRNNQHKYQTPNAVHHGGQVPPRPPRNNNTSGVYGGDGESLNSTPGNNRTNNYRKVFKPNVPQMGSTPETGSNDSVDRANALALGMAPQNRKNGLYEPERHERLPRTSGQAHEYHQGANNGGMNSENSVLQSSPAQRGRVGLPPTNRSAAMGRARQSHQSRLESSPVEKTRPDQQNYQFDEDMADPFAQKKQGGGGVQNTPPKSNPLAGNQPQQSNFHNEFASQNQNDGMNMPDSGAQLIQCDTCERKFNAKALERHQKICVKVFQTKRKVFNMAEQRKATDASGKGIEEGSSAGYSNFKPKIPRNNKAGMRPSVGKADASESATNKQPAKIPKWKLQSMQFRQAVGPIKPTQAGGGGMNFNPSMEASEPADDRVLCEFCGRKFAEKTAERHIPHCESKYKANLMKNGPPPRGGSKPARGRAPSHGMRR